MERGSMINTIKVNSKKLEEKGFTEDELTSILDLNEEEVRVKYADRDKDTVDMLVKYHTAKTKLSYKNKKIKETKNKLLEFLKNKVDENIKTNGKHHIRKLNSDDISDKNIISVFESSLTRTIKAKPDEFTDSLMVVQVYYFDIIKDLIYFGYEYNGERYRYFSSSAGQIRKKKCVFIKESVWNEHENTITCGLTIDKINSNGGCIPCKYLSYLCLANSATDVWEEFDIDKVIVVDDFETLVHGTYDLIDDVDYSITRTSGDVPIPHTDGAGMILPNAFGQVQKNTMVRLPWIKGLLGVFDFKKFIEYNHYSPTIKDIYGVEHDVIAEDIKVILTASQFKMYKYYSSFQEYKDCYKKYGCHAGKTNVEEDRIKNATINYQMLQTLTDITDEEIDQIIYESNNELTTLCDSVENMQKIFGITPYNDNKTPFQKCLELYPALMNDEYVKSKIRDMKNSMVKRYKAGKLKIDGKYTFVLPDFYAACEYWFGGIENPKGLLDDGEVFCWLFRRSEKLDCLRSPHLYMEHAIRKNVAYKDDERQEKLREWFTTDGIYTSTYDLITRILQNDCDGDKYLVVADKTFVDIAERNAQGIVPLYYNMRKANPSELTNESIYKGLEAAFVGGNIGIYSNNISKIWNGQVFMLGTKEEKQNALDMIKLLVSENNFVIDYAKTLYKPKRPKHIDRKIKEFIKENIPHFFIYAKDKKISQVAEKNDSFVNKLEDKIVNPRISCRKLKLGKIDYKLLMNNPDIDVKMNIMKNGMVDKKNTDPLILKYLELSKNHYKKFDYEIKDNPKRWCAYNKVIKDTKKELAEFGYDEAEIVDILIYYLYHISHNKHKSLLWNCYGNVIYENLSKHMKLEMRDVQCVDCGKWFQASVKNKRACRCDVCKEENDKVLRKERNRRYYLKNRV